MEKTTNKQNTYIQESRVASFRNAALEKMNKTYIPGEIILYREFIESLKKKEIDVSSITRFGCPCHYIPTFAKLCNDEKPKASHCKQCILCWITALATPSCDNSFLNSKEKALSDYTKEELIEAIKKTENEKTILNILKTEKENNG